MSNPWDYEKRPSIFADDKNFNGKNEKKKTSVSVNVGLMNIDLVEKKKLNLITNYSRKIKSK